MIQSDFDFVLDRAIELNDQLKQARELLTQWADLMGNELSASKRPTDRQLISATTQFLNNS